MGWLPGLGEARARVVRWSLLVGWLLLIASLLMPSIQAPAWMLPVCPPELATGCVGHRHPGNRLFWGTVVPSGLLVIGVVSHELWRRVCPLAFVSQLARALDWQRTRPGRGGKPKVVLVAADSWLGQHHLQLQWSLLIAGLCLRLLAVNASPLGLAILLIATIAAALLVGWAYGGKAWCHYVCPMGPVQRVLTGMRGPLGSRAHVGTTSRITQSMCRTIADDGGEKSACVACQAPCIDIDAEWAFWQTLRGKRGLSWAYTSYPGLVVAFFLVMGQTGAGAALSSHPLGYLRSGQWAFDASLPDRVWSPLAGWSPLPRLFLIPLVLVAAGWLSVALFRLLELILERRYRQQHRPEPAAWAIQHTRLLASFVAINEFFWFADPSLGLLGDRGTHLLRSLVLAATAIGLHRSWGRDQATYRRESASESLRWQLRDLPGLDAALDGRALEALSPQEVFTLVKAMPALGRQQGRRVYRDVMVDMLRSGRLDRASSLLELQDLRQGLQLEESDHHEVVRSVAREQPDLLQHDRLQQQAECLRQEAAEEGIRELLTLAGLPVLDLETLSSPLQERLEQWRQKSLLEPDQWRDLLAHFGPDGVYQRERLEAQVAAWLKEAGLRSTLRKQAAEDVMLRPLLRAMDLRLAEARRDLDGRLAAAAQPPLPAEVPGEGDLEQVFQLLWQEPDPDTAGWVLMLARDRNPAVVARLLQMDRVGLSDSPFLQLQREGQKDPEQQEFPFLAACELFGDLLPEGILWVAHRGHLQELEAGELVMAKGAASDFLALVLAGDVRLVRGDDRPIVLTSGSTIGEMGVITGECRSASVYAGPGGARLFVLPAQVFEDLLQRSRRFGRGLLGQLAQRLVAQPA